MRELLSRMSSYELSEWKEWMELEDEALENHMRKLNPNRTG